MSTLGTMVILLKEGYLRRDTEMFGKMDPYVMFNVNGDSFISRTCMNAGKYPKWEQKVAFRCRNNDSIKFQVMDEDSNGKDDLIGEGDFCFELNDKDCLFKPQNVDIQLYYKTKNVGEVKMTVNFYSDGKKHKNIQQEIQEQLLIKEQQMKQAQTMKQSANMNKLAESSKDVQQKLQVIDQLEDQIQDQKKNNKKIANEIQEAIREQENSQLQSEVIGEQMNYNKLKNQVIVGQMQKFQEGKFIGKLILQGFTFQFITGLDDKSNIQICFVISNSNNQQLYNLVPKKQDRKTIKWDQKYELQINNGHSIMFQAYHTKEKRLIGIGNIPLLSIGRNIKSTTIGMYKQDTLQANLTSDLGFQQADQ